MTMTDHQAAALDLDVTRGDVLSYGEPTDEELAAINKHARRTLSRSDVYVVDARPSDTSVDSHFTRMDPDTTLNHFAEDATEGVPILNSHGAAGSGFIDLPIGRSFAGQVLRDDYKTPRGTTLHATKTHPAVYSAHYLPRGVTTSSTSNDDLIRAIDAGILPDVSVGFGNTRPRGSGYWYRCDECGQNLLRSSDCTHYPGMVVTSDNGTKSHRATATVMDAGLKEYSHVWRGSNPSAQLLRKASDLVTRGVLSHAAIVDIDRVTGRHMADALDWQALKRTTGRFVVAQGEKTVEPGTAGVDAAADDERRQVLDEALGGAEAPGTGTGTGTGTTTNDASRQQQDQQPAADHPLVVALRTAGVEDDAGLRALLTRAEDGQRYRTDLVDLYHKAGVRAYGAEYNRERHERALGAMTTDDLLGFIGERNAVAKRLYGKDTPGQGADATEKMRGQVVDQVGGRQTVPAGGMPPMRRSDETQQNADDEASRRRDDERNLHLVEM